MLKVTCRPHPLTANKKEHELIDLFGGDFNGDLPWASVHVDLLWDKSSTADPRGGPAHHLIYKLGHPVTLVPWCEVEPLLTALEEIKHILAVGRNVGEDKEQAYRDAEDLADKAIASAK